MILSSVLISKLFKTYPSKHGPDPVSTTMSTPWTVFFAPQDTAESLRSSEVTFNLITIESSVNSKVWLSWGYFKIQLK